MTDFEQRVQKFLQGQGYKVLRNGWPDFLAVYERDGSVIAIEAKQGNDTLSDEQLKIHQQLISSGLPVFVVRPENLKSLPTQLKQMPNLKALYQELSSLQKDVEAQLIKISMYRDTINLFLSTIFKEADIDEQEVGTISAESREATIQINSRVLAGKQRSCN